MDANLLRFTLNGVNYQIRPHVWRDHPERIGWITVEQIRNTIAQPDFQEVESWDRTVYWKWFSDFGEKGNFVKVVVNSREATHFVTTAHPDGNLRKRRGRI